jgi:hypothetical protein
LSSTERALTSTENLKPLMTQTPFATGKAAVTENAQVEEEIV